MEFSNYNLADTILLFLLGMLFLIQILYLIIVYFRIHKHTNDVKKGKVTFSEELPPVSVIICANNETENLQKNLPSVLEQDYPRFEVVVVNDSLSDESEDFLKRMENIYPHLYHTFTPDSSRYLSRKKLAITIGIKASKYDWLVFTEADCTPSSKNWLRFMARNFTEDTGIVLGYSGYLKGKGWLALKSNFDNLLGSMRYMGCALLGKPYMGKGRNMAYRKNFFFQKKGFSSHLNLQRGEDNLFINEIVSPSNTRIETDKGAIVWMSPLKNKKDWTEEKLNEATTSRYLKGTQRYWMGGETFSRILFYILLITCIVSSVLSHQWTMLGLSVLVFLVRYAVQITVFSQTSRDLDERCSILLLPLFDLLQPVYNFKYKMRSTFRKKEEYIRK